VEKLNGSNLVAPVQGKLIQIEEIDSQNGKLFRNIVMAPAADEYDFPNTVSVMSERRIGQINDVVTTQLKIRGRRQNNNGKTFYNSDLWEKI